MGASYDEASIIAGRELERNWNSVDNLTMKSSDKTTAILNEAVGIGKIDRHLLLRGFWVQRSSIKDIYLGVYFKGFKQNCGS